jgi:hypothetical protein
MIRRAFEVISIPTRLICFSDDMDGMRKVPGNVPNQEMLREHLQKPLTAVPDPFGTHSKASATTTTRCCAGSSIPSGSSTSSIRRPSSMPRAVRRDPAALRRTLRRLMEIMLKSLREERQQTYSIFLPLHPETGRVLYVPMKHVDAKDGKSPSTTRTARMDRAGHRRQREAAVEARFRRALGGAGRRFRDVRQGPLHQHADLRRDLPDRSGRAAPSISPTSCSSTRRARRSPSRRATGCRSTNG